MERNKWKELPTDEEMESERLMWEEIAREEYLAYLHDQWLLQARAVCLACYEVCKIVVEDFGNGPYEYWGAKGTHVDLQDVSDCCGADYWIVENL